MGNVNDALAWLQGRAGELESALRTLVEISSHTPDIAGNDAVAAAYAQLALTLGRGALDVATVPSANPKYGRHVTFSTAAGKRRGAVMLVGHHDTVFPQAAFSGFRDDGTLLRGPGVLDMKGGLVVIAFALGALAEAGLLADTPVRVVSISDEEVGSPDGKRLVLEAAQGASASLVFESGRTNDAIITMRKRVGGMTATATGKAAHAGNVHHEGCNAIWALARFIDAAQRLTDYDRGVTVNVGKISGGIGKNTVPDRAEALLDFRFLQTAHGQDLESALRQVASEAAQAVPGTSLELS